jgi:hypothetical protein
MYALNRTSKVARLTWQFEYPTALAVASSSSSATNASANASSSGIGVDAGDAARAAALVDAYNFDGGAVVRLADGRYLVAFTASVPKDHRWNPAASMLVFEVDDEVLTTLSLMMRRTNTKIRHLPPFRRARAVPGWQAPARNPLERGGVVSSSSANGDRRTWLRSDPPPLGRPARGASVEGCGCDALTRTGRGQGRLSLSLKRLRRDATVARARSTTNRARPSR